MDISLHFVNIFHKIKLHFSDLLRRSFRIPILFQDLQNFHDNTKVVLFTNQENKWPDYDPRFKTGPIQGNRTPKVSLIASVKNEENNIHDWFERINGQSRLPDEIIIVDGGSSDRTYELLIIYANKCLIPTQIHRLSNSNIAQSRNFAIMQSKYEVIAVTDFGCLPAYNWLENIVEPFSVDPEIVVSAGIYDPIYSKKSSLNMKKLWTWGNLVKITPESYLPPGGSIAFLKSLWQNVGGYPEWLTLTGEDTFFDLELKQLGGKWAFVPEAIVEWYPPEKLLPYILKIYNWAIGDGEIKVRGPYLWKFAIRSFLYFLMLISIILIPLFFPSSFFGNFRFDYPISILIITILVFVFYSVRKSLSVRLIFFQISGKLALLVGYIRGALRQNHINRIRYANIKGVIILLSGIPIDDTGGGSRSAQISMEFLRRNFLVIYLYRFPKYESKNLDLNTHHANLIVKSLEEINFKSLLLSFQGIIQESSLYVIVEHPIKEFIPAIKYIRKLNGKIIYEKIDDWNTSLGGKWFSEKNEKRIILQSKILIATAPILVSQLHETTGRKVNLVPNAVNLNIFNLNNDYKIPKDMPQGDWIGIYIGALWGDWFDWNLLARIGETYPEAVFPIIGDLHDTPDTFLPKNVLFLGLKKQTELPAYLKYSNVSIVPWKISPITEATSPLKIYESIAMGCPAVTPCLKTLDGIPGVFQAKNHDEFIKYLDLARKSKISKKDTFLFIEKNTWETRIERILKLCKNP